MTLCFLRAIHGNVTFHQRNLNCLLSFRTFIKSEPGYGCHDHPNWYPHVFLAASDNPRYSELDFQKTDLLFVGCETPLRTKVDLKNLVNIRYLDMVSHPVLSIYYSGIYHVVDKASDGKHCDNTKRFTFRPLIPCFSKGDGGARWSHNKYTVAENPIISNFNYDNYHTRGGYQLRLLKWKKTRITLTTGTLPFDNFSFLVENKFTILSRVMIPGDSSAAGNMWIDVGYRIINEMVLKLLSMSLHIERGHEVGYGVITELLAFAQNQNSFYDQFLAVGVTLASQRPSPFTQYLPDNVERDPNWAEIWANIIPQESILRECNKIALLLWAIEAHEMYHKLQQLTAIKNRKNTFPGNPAHPVLSFSFGLRFMHWTSPLILQRIRGLKESGIQHWFENFVVKFLTKVKTPRNIFKDEDERNAFRPSDINGNIVVVFVPLEIGMVIALITFGLLDCRWQPVGLRLQAISRSFVRKLRLVQCNILENLKERLEIKTSNH